MLLAIAGRCMTACAWLFLMALVLSVRAQADGTVERQTAVKLYRGSSIIAASDPNSSRHVAGLTPEVCEQLRETAWQEEAATRTSGVATYKCQVEERAIVAFHSAPPAPVCGDRPGDDEQEPRTCPAGTVGTWMQDRIWTLQPYPDCWVLGEWEPTQPPVGMCAPTELELLPAPTNLRAEGVDARNIRVTWSPVAGASAYPFERCIGSTCVPVFMLCATDTTVTHGPFQSDGLSASYRVQASRDAACSAAADNLGAYSEIVVGSTVSAPPASGTASLAWTPPTQNTDGSALTNLAGFRISYGTSPNALVQSVQIANTGVSSYNITGLAPGPWYFGVMAYTSGGTASDLSNVMSKVVQ